MAEVLELLHKHSGLFPDSAEGLESVGEVSDPGVGDSLDSLELLSESEDVLLKLPHFTFPALIDFQVVDLVLGNVVFELNALLLPSSDLLSKEANLLFEMSVFAFPDSELIDCNE